MTAAGQPPSAGDGIGDTREHPRTTREAFVRGFESTAPAGAVPPPLYLDEPIPLSPEERIALATLRRLVDRGVVGPEPTA